MPRFALNRRTMQYEVARLQSPSENDVFHRVKRIYGIRLRQIQMTDADIRELISRVSSGTRNAHYLAPHGKYQERSEIIFFVLREIAF